MSENKTPRQLSAEAMDVEAQPPSMERIIKHINAALAEIKYLATPPS